MSQKSDLIEKLIHNPREFTDANLQKLIQLNDFSKDDLWSILRRIFDLNISDIEPDQDDSDTGLLGKANKLSRKKRVKLFKKKIRKEKFSKLIVAEGDSWFEFPIFVSDILDHLNRRKYSYAIYSQAAAGDWMTKMLHLAEYFPLLSRYKPDVFLISGGGNDLVGGFRISHLVKKRNTLNLSSNLHLNTFEEQLEFAEKCLSKDFWALLNLFKIQYTLMFNKLRLNTDKFKDMRIITQGYDYAIPDARKRLFVNNGSWLKDPLVINGYQSKTEQKSIILGLIHYFNEMLIEVGSKYPNIYHIDSRGFVDAKRGWRDELHPKSYQFKKIAEVFSLCIEDEEPENRVFKVKDLIS